jgi:hypothetical protein
MMSEERFERIERDLAAAAALALRNEQALKGLTQSLKGLTEAGELQQRNQGALTEAIASYAANADARAQQTDATIRELAAAVTRYVDAADARMKRIEENLDALIRAITLEHSNGKGKV